MPYFSMAMRSIPMPKAKPWYRGAVDAAVLQHVGMDHAAAQDLQPVAAVADLQLAAPAQAADIDLGRGLGEGEEAGAEAQRQVVHVEEGAAELDQAALAGGPCWSVSSITSPST